MKKDRIKFYKFQNEKVTIFDSIKKNKAGYKIIIRNSLLISIIFIIFFSSVILYSTNKINVAKASVLTSSNNPVEKESNINKIKQYKIDYTKKYEIIVNKTNPINEDIISSYELVNVEDNLYNNIRIEKETYKNYLKLKKALGNKGYYLYIKNGFSRNNISEHSTGLSFDVIVTKKEKSASTNIKSDEYKLFSNIIYLYGFIIRYPKNKEKITGYYYEPCHIRYVGRNLAKYLTKNNLTLEEYYLSKEY